MKDVKLIVIIKKASEVWKGFYKSSWAYTTTFSREGKRFRVMYTTSAPFNFCDKCGSFSIKCLCGRKEYCLVTEKEVNKEVEKVLENPFMYYCFIDGFEIKEVLTNEANIIPTSKKS